MELSWWGRNAHTSECATKLSRSFSGRSWAGSPGHRGHLLHHSDSLELGKVLAPTLPGKTGKWGARASRGFCDLSLERQMGISVWKAKDLVLSVLDLKQ